ncbi:type II toxin-antitoxin system VapC family toxin [Bosea vaviloviae]|uniref:type II toxin-antitoxin system VapC family toxin n=1 Tax=Bosea vaviloviae TaxID=1526658 RepID=UPI0009F3095F|nr:type II toxin-antitoxin system VapC family toxin [Bosea vaviloviae]
MIVVDASAMAAILGRESDGEALAQRLENWPRGPELRHASTVTLWEAASAVARLHRVSRDRAFELVTIFCELTMVTPIAPDAEITAGAVAAAERYGLGGGRPGILNLGACFSYATARHLKARLLFKGDDFSRTDIEAA